MSSERVGAKSLQALFSCTIPDALMRKMSKVNGKRLSPYSFPPNGVPNSEQPMCSGSVCATPMCVGACGCGCGCGCVEASRARAVYVVAICTGAAYVRPERLGVGHASKNCCYEEICHGKRRYGKH